MLWPSNMWFSDTWILSRGFCKEISAETFLLASDCLKLGETDRSGFSSWIAFTASFMLAWGMRGPLARSRRGEGSKLRVSSRLKPGIRFLWASSTYLERISIAYTSACIDGSGVIWVTSRLSPGLSISWSFNP